MLDDIADPLYALTCTTCGSEIILVSRREKQAFDGICRGQSNKEIALTLGVTPKTAKNIVSRLFLSLGLSSRLQVVVYNQSHDVQSLPHSNLAGH